jgi:hypothetical protein
MQLTDSVLKHKPHIRFITVGDQDLAVGLVRNKKALLKGREWEAEKR